MVDAGSVAASEEELTTWPDLYYLHHLEARDVRVDDAGPSQGMKPGTPELFLSPNEKSHLWQLNTMRKNTADNEAYLLYDFEFSAGLGGPVFTTSGAEGYKMRHDLVVAASTNGDGSYLYQRTSNSCARLQL